MPIDFFFEPGCEDCERIRRDVLPALEAGYSSRYALREWDVGVQSNYLRLARTLDRLGRSDNAHVYMSVGDRLVLAGVDEVEAGLFEALENELTGGTAAPVPAPPPARDGGAVAADMMGRFTAAGVLLAGLGDGLNPCAFSTLVFFISILAIARVRGRVFLAAGAAFCAASFLTYFLIGFGLLHALRRVQAFGLLRAAVEAAMVVALLAFAALSLRDALRFHSTGRPGDVTLQLPRRVRDRIHELMRTRLRPGRIALSAFGIGAAVTALESVCTGQLYLPTLVYVARAGGATSRALLYLLLYNTAFVAPLVAVFLVTWRGLEFRRLLEWSARNVVVSKILLGCLFLLLAVAIALL